MIFAAGGSDSATTIEIIENGLSLESIDSLLQKEHRLKTMRSWDQSVFNEHLGDKTEYALITGQALSGKSLVAGFVKDCTNSKLIDFAAIAEAIRPRLGDEAEPFEGRIPDAEVEKDLVAMIAADKNSGEKYFYIVDGRHHETEEQAATFLKDNMGAPSYIIKCTAEFSEIEARYKEKNEVAEDLPEEDAAALREKANQAEMDYAKIKEVFDASMSRVKEIDIDSGVSKETIKKKIAKLFKPRVILINHEKRIDVDTACSNLAIKYNMLYISVYQLIRAAIEGNTEAGRALLATKRTVALNFGPQVKSVDPYNEKTYSALNFDSDLVM